MDEEMHKKYIANDDSPEKRALVDEIITMIYEEFGLDDQVYTPPRSEGHSKMVDDAHRFYSVVSGITNNYIDAVISIFTLRKWIKLINAGLPTGQIILRTYYTKEQLEMLKGEFIKTFYEDDYDEDDDMEGDEIFDMMGEEEEEEENVEPVGIQEDTEEMPALCASDDDDNWHIYDGNALEQLALSPSEDE